MQCFVLFMQEIEKVGIFGEMIFHSVVKCLQNIFAMSENFLPGSTFQKYYLTVACQCKMTSAPVNVFSSFTVTLTSELSYTDLL